jgi:hypothetical protein
MQEKKDQQRPLPTPVFHHLAKRKPIHRHQEKRKGESQ